MLLILEAEQNKEAERDDALYKCKDEKLKKKYE